MNSLLAKFSISLGTMTLPTPLSWGGQTTLERVKAATTELEKLTENEMRETGIPGIAIAVVFKDQAVFAKGFGVREVGKPDLVDADAVFQLASVSKPIGSTVVAALVGEGLLPGIRAFASSIRASRGTMPGLRGKSPSATFIAIAAAYPSTAATYWRSSATLARKSFTAFAIKGRVAASDQDTLTPISA